jgi:hypothetical protein
MENTEKIHNRVQTECNGAKNSQMEDGIVVLHNSNEGSRSYNKKYFCLFVKKSNPSSLAILHQSTEMKWKL